MTIATKNRTQGRGPLPLIVGVTGHIDIVDGALDTVRTSVRQLLDTLSDAYPDTPIEIVSALAEGADQMVVQEALALKLPVVCIFPMPILDYADTFATDEGRRLLFDLSARARLRIELPEVPHAQPADQQVDRFEQAGLTISHFSHILIAIWNGSGAWNPDAPTTERRAQQGGTAHIVYLRTSGEAESSIFGNSAIFPVAHTRFYPVDSGLTLRIAAPHRKSAECIGAIGSIWSREGEESTHERLVDLATLAKDARRRAESDDSESEAEPEDSLESNLTKLARLDKANRLLIAVESIESSRVEHAEQKLTRSSVLAELGEQREAAQHIRHAYALADVLSQENQRLVHIAIFGAVVALLSAVLAYELYAHVPMMQSAAMLFFYLLVVALPVILQVGLVKRYEWQNRFQDFRALTEALRVQFFWGLSGVACGVTDFYLRKHQDEMSWIRRALRGAALDALALGLGPVRRQIVQTYWLESQLAYFAGRNGTPATECGRAELNRRKRAQKDYGISVAYGAGLCIAAALFLVELIHLDIGEPLRVLAIVLMGFAPAFAGGLSVISEKRAFKDHAHQYSRMGRIFRRALYRLSRQREDDARAFSLIMRELGAEALAESGDWLISHRDRRVDPIRGG